jgi:hypothetical protein
MNYSILLPSGARLTMLPPGTSEGAETNPECFRVLHGSVEQPRKVRGVAFQRSLHFKNSGPVELPCGKLWQP